MSHPFGPVRRAVLGGPPEPAFTPYLTAVGAFRVGAGYVARFPGVAYPRDLVSAAMSCSVVCPVTIYLGDVITPTSRLSNYGDGSKTSYNPPRPDHVAPNMPVLVVWETTVTGGTASVNAQFRQVA